VMTFARDPPGAAAVSTPAAQTSSTTHRSTPFHRLNSLSSLALWTLKL